MSTADTSLTNRVRESVKRWFQNRLQECVRCFECHGAVSPWDTNCPTCGQGNPARVSASAGIYLGIAFGAAALVVWSAYLIF